jgi:menaquinone-dependent protoporphyrinogen oxidase
MKRPGAMVQVNISCIERSRDRPWNRLALFLCFLSVFAWLFAGCACTAMGEGVEGLKGRVLVAFETKKGSTREIAETIAEEIRAAGWDAEAVDIKDSPNPEDYSHVIAGGPIYMGSIKGLRSFVDGHETALKERLVGAFAAGMFFAVDDEEKHASGRKALDEAIAPLAPEHRGYFAGKIDPEKLSLIEKAMIKMVKSPVGDYRDWAAVRSWAQEVIETLTRTLR